MEAQSQLSNALLVLTALYSFCGLIALCLTVCFVLTFSCLPVVSPVCVFVCEYRPTIANFSCPIILGLRFLFDYYL